MLFRQDQTSAVLSFLLPGLGQLYQERLAATVVCFGLFTAIACTEKLRWLTPFTAVAVALEAMRYQRKRAESRVATKQESPRRRRIFSAVGIAGFFGWFLLYTAVLFPTLAHAEDDAPPVEVENAPAPPPPLSQPQVFAPPPQMSSTDFRFGSGLVTIRVLHPFRVVEMTTEAVQGTLHLNPMDLSRDASLQFFIPISSFMPDGRLGGYLSTLLLPKGAPQDASFESSYVERMLFNPEQKPAHAFEVAFHGRLKIADTLQWVRVGLDCTYDVPAIRCTVHSEFPISGFGFRVPRMLWVQAKDEVVVQGDVFFGPQQVQK